MDLKCGVILENSDTETKIDNLTNQLDVKDTHIRELELQLVTANDSLSESTELIK